MQKSMKPERNNPTNKDKLETNGKTMMEINEKETRNVEITRKVDKLDRENIKTFDKFENSNLSNTCTNRDFTVRDFYLCERLNKIKVRKQHNLIIFGAVLPNALCPEEQTKNDKDLITNMLNLIGINVKNKIVSIERLNSNQTLPPIRIKFNDTLSPIKILKSAKILKNAPEFKQPSISLDLLVEERAAIQIMVQKRNELNKQLNETEPNSPYYYGIRSNKIVMKNKVTNKTNETEDKHKLLIHSTQETLQNEMHKAKIIELTNEINNLKTKIVKQAESMKAINDHWSTTKTTLINEINNIKRRMDTNKERIDQCKGEITNRKH